MKINGVKLLRLCKSYFKKERVEVTGYWGHIKLYFTRVKVTLKKKGLKSLGTGYK